MSQKKLFVHRQISKKRMRERANDPNYKHFSWLFRGTFVERGNVHTAGAFHSSRTLGTLFTFSNVYRPPYRSWSKSTFPFSSASEHMRVDFLPSSPFSRPRCVTFSSRSVLQHTIGSTASIPFVKGEYQLCSAFRFLHFSSGVYHPQVCPRFEK